MPCRYTGHYCLTLGVSCLTCFVYPQSCWCCCLPCPCQAVTDLSGDRPRPPCCRSARRGRSASAGPRTCSVTTHCAATSGRSWWRRTERENWCAPTPPCRGNVYTSQTGSPVALHVQADRVLLYAGSQPGQVLWRRVLLLPHPGGLSGAWESEALLASEVSPPPHLRGSLACNRYGISSRVQYSTVLH